MRILSLDIGDATIGLALSDPLMITAQGLEVYRRISVKQDIKYLESLIVAYDVQKVVYGLPIKMDGSDSLQTEKTRTFVKQIEKKLRYGPLSEKGIVLIPMDERLTSAQATATMKLGDLNRKSRAERIDMIAAQLILEQYLNSEAKDE